MKNRPLKYFTHSDMHDETYRLKPNRFSKPVRFILSAFVVLLFSACKKDNAPQVPPKIQLLHQTGMISSDTTIAFGDVMSFTIAAESGSANLTNLVVFKKSTSSISQRALDTGMNIQHFTITKHFTKGLDEFETWTFGIRDKNRLAAGVSVNIRLDSTSGFGPINTYESLTLSAQNLAGPGSFFSFISGESYSLDEATQNQDIIDLIYYFGEDQHTIASPGANIENGIFEGNFENWDIFRTTRFIEIDLSEDIFESAQNDSLLIVSYIEGEGKRKAKLLAIGKSFSFKTQDMKYGIFRVIEVEGADVGTIKLDVKIQDKD
jgi:hypothetical protein